VLPPEDIRRCARQVVEAARVTGPPVHLERYFPVVGITRVVREAGVGDADVRPMGPRRWSLVIDRALVPHTPQWNGAVALALARVMIPAGAAGEAAARLSEIAAAELLLPMRFFRPRALRTDLTMDGVRELAMHFVAPIRLTVRQWLESGTWYGLAMLWREVSGEVRLRWRAASPGVRFPTTVALGAPAESVWSPKSRLYSTLRTGRPHHGVEEVRVGPGAIWWFTRFGVVRDDWGRSPGPRPPRAVLALVSLARR
jgi:hypothetical protein